MIGPYLKDTGKVLHRQGGACDKAMSLCVTQFYLGHTATYAHIGLLEGVKVHEVGVISCTNLQMMQITLKAIQLTTGGQ